MSDTNETIEAAVSSAAKSSPDAPLLYDSKSEPYTYGDLRTQLGSIQNYLNGIGVGRMDRVASVVSNSPIAATCFFAVAASSAYTPLTPDLETDEFIDILSRLTPKALIIERGINTKARDAANELGILILELLSDTDTQTGNFILQGGTRGSCTAPGFSHAEDIAVILTTSGTTAHPKLVPIKQAQLLCDSRQKSTLLELTSDDKGLIMFPPYYGSAFKSALMPTLVSGSSLIWCSPFDAAQFFDVVRKYNPTWFNGGATVMKAVVDYAEKYSDAFEAGEFRFIRSSVASLDNVYLNKLQAMFDAPVIECYSSTESSGISGNPLPPGIQKPNSVGKPLQNEVAIFDNSGHQVPKGAEGEIVVRGPAVFDGYLDDPEANAAAFFDDWYRTGDIGRFDEDGYLYITGRLKDMISRGGQKIAPVAIDKLLEQHASIDQAATFSIPHPTLGEEVATAIKLIPGAEENSEEIIAFCRQRMAAYKVPKILIFVDEIPRDPTGKIKRKELSDRFSEMHTPWRTSPSNGDIISARTPTEAALSGLWSSVLEIENLGIDDDYFLMGGDSLRAATLFSEVNHIFGTDLSMDQMFDGITTVRKMADLIEQVRNVAPPVISPAAQLRQPNSTLVAIHASGNETPLFAVPGVGGHAIGLIPLARCLGVDRPIYGFQSRGLDGLHSPLDRIEDIAGDHLIGLRSAQPSGPYFIFGACFGAIVAFEMARQLTMTGDEIGRLILLDPPAPGPRDLNSNGEKGQKINRREDKLLFEFLRIKLRRNTRELLTENWPNRIKYVFRKLGIVLEIIRNKGLSPERRSEITAILVEETNSLAVRAYSPNPICAPTTLLLSSDRHADFENSARNIWLDFLPKSVRIVKVPGHDSGAALISPNVEILAEKLQYS